MIEPRVGSGAMGARAAGRTWLAACALGRGGRRASAPAAPQRPAAHDFSSLIARLAPGEDPAHVEAWMRSAHGTLESIEPLRFAREVQLAVERVRTLATADSDALARSYGLVLRKAAPGVGAPRELAADEVGAPRRSAAAEVGASRRSAVAEVRGRRRDLPSAVGS